MLVHVTGASSGRNPPETQPEQQDQAAGRGEEQPARTAGRGGGGQKELGKTNVSLAVAGKWL